MTNAIYFFASKQDLCNIFKSIENEFEIKYCANYVYDDANHDEQPRIAFHTIEEIADSYGELYFIVPKSQTMHTICQTLHDEAKVRYITECNGNEGRLTFRTKRSNPNGYECDYVVYPKRIRNSIYGRAVQTDCAGGKTKLRTGQKYHPVLCGKRTLSECRRLCFL